MCQLIAFDIGIEFCTMYVVTSQPQQYRHIALSFLSNELFIIPHIVVFFFVNLICNLKKNHADLCLFKKNELIHGKW